ncbi:MAG: hypothetical protein NDJ89_12890 [Oligoflexia bacterium]|nr:hypothetical protein [Oligoflexia bacterium]
MKSETLTLTDRMGIFYGVIFFFFMLPLSIFLGSIPSVILSDVIQNKVAALAAILAILGLDIVVTFFVGIILGLVFSYALSAFGRLLRIQQTVAAMLRSERLIEDSRKSNLGGLLGGGATLVAFFAQGQVPIHSVTRRVEHLFPAPLVLNLGETFRFDLSHMYAATTGFLAVGFLYAIAGIVLGTLVAAVVDLAIASVRS